MKIKGHKIDWLNHSLEFVVVIVGILIAFQLNKCSFENEQSLTIDIHSKEIIKETNLNKTSFENAIKYDELNLMKMDTLFKLLENKNNFIKANHLSLELLNLGGVYIRKNAYKILIESGDIRFIRNYEEKQNIVNLYEYYKWVESFNEISMNLYTSDYYPYLKNNFDLVKGSIQKDEIYTSKEFMNILGAYYRTSQNRLQKYKDCLVEINKYLESNN
ncbi:hypothetical protein [uncultured Lutibacter sp.]|uniref:hypothetical protein n=1 Tax=uncultured Lutibacter sp. TaxID=437739 RepID=UPI002624485E|nr:hypothetical protein [uncultured Lutibacter sp.]